MEHHVQEKTTDRQRVGAGALEWWTALQRDKGARAQLKRCGEPMEVFFCPTFHDLARGLEAWGRRQKETVAVMAGVLAHVKRDVGGSSFAAQMAARKNRQKAVVSGLRFRRLIQIKEREDLFDPLIRIVRLLDSTANVADLAYSVWQWEHPDRFVQRDWACDYYEQAAKDEP